MNICLVASLKYLILTNYWTCCLMMYISWSVYANVSMLQSVYNNVFHINVKTITSSFWSVNKNIKFGQRNEMQLVRNFTIFLFTLFSHVIASSSKQNKFGMETNGAKLKIHKCMSLRPFQWSIYQVFIGFLKIEEWLPILEIIQYNKKGGRWDGRIIHTVERSFVFWN